VSGPAYRLSSHIREKECIYAQCKGDRKGSACVLTRLTITNNDEVKKRKRNRVCESARVRDWDSIEWNVPAGGRKDR